MKYIVFSTLLLILSLEKQNAIDLWTIGSSLQKKAIVLDSTIFAIFDEEKVAINIIDSIVCDFNNDTRKDRIVVVDVQWEERTNQSEKFKRALVVFESINNDSLVIKTMYWNLVSSVYPTMNSFQDLVGKGENEIVLIHSKGMKYNFKYKMFLKVNDEGKIFLLGTETICSQYENENKISQFISEIPAENVSLDDTLMYSSICDSIWNK